MIWVAIALLGGVGWSILAIFRGETINAIWFVFAAVCTYLIGYRFYSKFIERKMTRAQRPPGHAGRVQGGRQGLRRPRTAACSSATTSPPSPAPARWSGPILAAQMGYLPGTMWIIVGVVLAGAVQDYLVLFFSMRRGGRSLGQMAREELGVDRRHRRPDRHADHHDHHRGDPGPGGRQRPGRVALGRLLGRA